MAKEITITRFECTVCTHDYSSELDAVYCEEKHKKQKEEEDRLSKCHYNHGAEAVTSHEIKCVSCKELFIYRSPPAYNLADLVEDKLYKCTHCGHEAYIDHWED